MPGFTRERGKPRAGSLLVVAGEGSGDAMAAPVVARLGAARCFGLGGPALRAAGVELVADLRNVAEMGVGGVLRRGPQIAWASSRLLWAIRDRKPQAALLVGYSEFNARLGPALRRRGIRVLWYGPPQVWAWRSNRAWNLADAADTLAVLLPFEEALWRSHGASAEYVGHPALERTAAGRADVRLRYDLTPTAEYVALLPGSRTSEVRRLLEPMLDAANLLRAERGAMDARVLLAPALPPDVVQWAAARAAYAGVPVTCAPAADILPAFNIALVASGTATLECALAGVPPVITYRVGPISARIAKALLEVDHVGLPNIVLGRSVFPELLQEQVEPANLARAALELLDSHAGAQRCADVRAALEAPLGGPVHQSPSERVAGLLRLWLT